MHDDDGSLVSRIFGNMAPSSTHTCNIHCVEQYGALKHLNINLSNMAPSSTYVSNLLAAACYHKHRMQCIYIYLLCALICMHKPPGPKAHHHIVLSHRRCCNCKSSEAMEAVWKEAMSKHKYLLCLSCVPVATLTAQRCLGK